MIYTNRHFDPFHSKEEDVFVEPGYGEIILKQRNAEGPNDYIFANSAADTDRLIAALKKVKAKAFPECEQAEVATCQEAITWHDVNESLPDADISVLLKTDSESYEVWPGSFDGERWWFCNGGIPRNVTHWADMPEGPGVNP